MARTCLAQALVPAYKQSAIHFLRAFTKHDRSLFAVFTQVALVFSLRAMPDIKIQRRENCATPPTALHPVLAEPAPALAHAAQSLLESVDNDLRRHIIAYANRRDVQTGLLNFHSFLNDLDSLLRELPPGQEIAVVWLDVLNVRREFALWGVDASEHLVRNVADALRSSVDAGTLLGRFGARCFVAAISAAKSDPAARHRLQDMLNAVL